MNIHYAESFLGTLKVAEGNEYIQDGYIQISNAIKIGMEIPLKCKNQSEIRRGDSNCFMDCVWIGNIAYSYRKCKKYMCCCDRLAFKVNVW